MTCKYLRKSITKLPSQPMQNHYEAFIERLEAGELDSQAEDFILRIREFASEVHMAALGGNLTAEETSLIWLRFLGQIGVVGVEVPPK